LNVDGQTYDVTHCNLDELGDRGIQWDDKKEIFFQLQLDDGRKLVGYVSNLKSFRAFMKQWRLMKRTLASKAREKSKIQRENARTQKKEADKTKSKNNREHSTVETAKALKALKELRDEGIISDSEYEEKRQALVNKL
jgi:deoxyribodipyrimidine photolyase